MVCGYTGPQFRSAYGLNDANTGRGVTVAVVDAYLSPTLFADAHRFAQTNDPGNPFTAGQFETQAPASFNKGGPNKCDASGWFGEQTLDVEAVHDVAPSATVLAAAAKNCDSTALNKALRNVIDQHSAQVVSNSYGDDGGDVLDTAGDRQATDSILLMAAATGVTVMFSSGDNGDEFTTIGQVAADYPASSPYATAVGGTSLQIGQSGQRLGEYGWSTARSFLCNDTLVSEGGCTASAGGPVAPDRPRAGWRVRRRHQRRLPAAVLPAGRRSELAVRGQRQHADARGARHLDGGRPRHGMLVGQTQQFPNGVFYDQYRIGGTSVASPLLAGVVARADQAHGSSLGFINPALYSLSGRPSALFDIGRPGTRISRVRTSPTRSTTRTDCCTRTGSSVTRARSSSAPQGRLHHAAGGAPRHARLRQHDGARFAGRQLRAGPQRALSKTSDVPDASC